MGLYFNAKHLPDPRNEYVAWVDIMGTSISMSRSLRKSANFVFKLHEAALEASKQEASKQDVILYPVMDGFYASSPNQKSMLTFLGNVFQRVAQEFNGENNPEHLFIIKGAVAFGPVVHGRRIPREASWIMDDNVPYRDNVLLGLPMVQAHTTEKCAPPFGIFVHESARTFSPDGESLPYIWWKWGRWKGSKNVETWDELRKTWDKLREKLESYYEWCTSCSEGIGYDSARISAHRKLARQYFKAEEGLAGDPDA